MTLNKTIASSILLRTITSLFYLISNSNSSSNNSHNLVLSFSRVFVIVLFNPFSLRKQSVNNSVHYHDTSYTEHASYRRGETRGASTLKTQGPLLKILTSENEVTPVKSPLQVLPSIHHSLLETPKL